MERASSGSAGPVAVAAAAAELELEREVRPDTVAPDTRNNESADQKNVLDDETDADLETEDFHLHHLHL